MPMNEGYIEFRLSGGAANADPAASLGGGMSSARIRSQSTTPLLNIATGITIIDAVGNPLGDGELYYYYYASANIELEWVPAGGQGGDIIPITESGIYVIPAAPGYGYLVVAVNIFDIPTSDAFDTVSVATLPNALWDDISPLESNDGDVEYRCMYVVNTHPTDTAYNVRVYIQTQPSGQDDLDIGLDPAGITGTATVVENESTAPAGVTFSRPATANAGLLIGDLDPGAWAGVWQRRTVPVGVTAATATDVSEIAVHMSLI